MSSEGERSPAEPLVAPLVFELKKLGAFYPCCWCEGHTYRADRVWNFRASGSIGLGRPARALADAIERLHAARRLAGRWHLVVAHSGAGNLDTTFSLEPEPAADQPLSRLQGDLRVMAEELAWQFWGVWTLWRRAGRRPLPRAVLCAQAGPICWAPHPEGDNAMRFSPGFRAALVALLALACATMAAPARADEGTISFSVIKAGFVVGGSGGSGTLTFHGKSYRLGIGGISYGLRSAPRRHASTAR